MESKSCSLCSFCSPCWVNPVSRNPDRVIDHLVKSLDAVGAGLDEGQSRFVDNGLLEPSKVHLQLDVVRKIILRTVTPVVKASQKLSAPCHYSQ